ncbi:MAG: hypothetical protein JWN23_149 [Rhodocyclales bacterium]|nr:hypothetical protein [Rhodocyclales bacterium]
MSPRTSFLRICPAIFQLFAGLVLVVFGSFAQAAPHVFSPIVEQGELELETRADSTFDRREALHHARSYNVDVGYGVNEFWAAEIETQWKQAPMEPRQYDSTSWENRFQLTPQGKYWLDAGIFAEYERVVRDGDHDNVTLGLLLQKEFGNNLTTFNLLFNRELGTDREHGLGVEYRFQSRWRVHPTFEPGIEIYGEPGRLEHIDSYENQRVRAGPALVGALPLGLPGKLKYEIAYLFGASRASEHRTVRTMLEYEAHF